MNSLTLMEFFDITSIQSENEMYQIRVRIKEGCRWKKGYKLVCCATKRKSNLYSAIVIINDNQTEYFFDKLLPNGIYDFHLLNMKDERVNDIKSIEHFVIGTEIEILTEIDDENDILIKLQEPATKDDLYGVYVVEQEESKEKFLIGMKQLEVIGEGVIERYITIDKTLLKKGINYEVRVFKSNYKVKWSWINIFSDEAYICSGISNTFHCN
ncbi:hypothetical protein EDI_255690 [Entamoeba dispar SAW760]|uniref:Uncharacterized protein n=1 Tax=Entamoeba dispar (strain ATCC PRA-260 / SAW760) TaxID=370354 RepID=B0EQ14_ENTDS|nr:uncharacterized protein EDI_255690 [Entamoeba dispar SAW760]EDR23383.1 hypothetical protein EDI_255690 [Entamoeba dispar SAW760]|eukprot:EDR23383.1 hypothetical protein EDI_255690 [Entamoeba dispar SAW760]